jgi:hypothetical protein
MSTESAQRSLGLIGGPKNGLCDAKSAQRHHLIADGLLVGR